MQREGFDVNQYAKRIISNPSKQDGLAWQNADGTWGCRTFADCSLQMCRARRPNYRGTVRPSRLRQMVRVIAFWEIGICLADLRMVPGARIELATPAFSGRRSTSELPRHTGIHQF
jgi:Protein of unknown function (DUF2950)